MASRPTHQHFPSAASDASSRSPSSLTPSLSTATRSKTSRTRSRSASTSWPLAENGIICAVTEGRGVSPTVGLAFINVSTCEAVLCQFADTQTYARACHKILVFEPVEILIADTARESNLVPILMENLTKERNEQGLTYISRRYWSESSGHEYLRQLALSDELESLKLSLAGKYFAVCSFAAALRYIDHALGMIFAPQTLRITFEPSEGAMMVDTSTITSLEIMHNLQNTKSKDCLFGLLNQTLTKMGARMLRGNVLQPSADREKISKRYEAVEELSSKETLFFAVREALGKFVDTDRTLAALVVVQRRADVAFMESSVNNVLMLKSFVDSIAPIFKALTGAESEELCNIRQLCDPENYIAVQNLIVYALNTDCTYSTQPVDLRNQRVYAIKGGVNSFLDVARQTYKEISEDITMMAVELEGELQMALALKYDPARQFYFKVKASELEDRDIPEVFTNIFRKRGWVECQTLDLMKLNQRLRDAHTEVMCLSDSSIQKLIDTVRHEIHPLFKISECIALLDMLAGFAQLVTIQNYVKPELLESTLAMKAARHPVLERIHKQTFVPNDVYATPQTRFQIITGCNMSGKSTYIRAIALTTVMAQIGCFVPAEYAGFAIMRQLFARVSTDDNIEANVSTFASEMREMAFILKNIEPRSLVIVDELGRGTSTADGLAIAIAISEALIESKAFTWFVTHFRDLPRILAARAGVVSLHFAVDIAPDLSKIKMMYKLAPGREEQSSYGLAIAKLVDLPQEVYDIATEVSRHLNERNEARKTNAKTLAVAKRRNLVLTLKEQLVQARESSRDNESLRLYLRKLQEEFIIRMCAIDAEVAAAQGITPEGRLSTDGTTQDADVSMLGQNGVRDEGSAIPGFWKGAQSPVTVQSCTGDHVDDPIEVDTDLSSETETASLG